LFACANSPAKTLNIQGIGAVHAINALSVDLYADWNHYDTWPIGGPAVGMRIKFQP
jgi:hypothetical protein